MTSIAKLDTLRTVAYTGVTGAYAAVGSPQAYPARIICWTNTTNADVIFSMDGSTSQLIVPAGGFKLFDVTTNHRPVNMDDLCFAVGTQWYVKTTGAPTLGSVFIDILYVQP